MIAGKWYDKLCIYPFDKSDEFRSYTWPWVCDSSGDGWKCDGSKVFAAMAAMI